MSLPDEVARINSAIKLGDRVVPPIGVKFLYCRETPVCKVEGYDEDTLIYRVFYSDSHSCLVWTNLETWLRSVELISLPKGCPRFEDWDRK